MVSVMERTQYVIEFVAKHYSKTVTNGVFCQDLYDNAEIVDIKSDDDNLKTVTFKVHTVKKLRNNMGMVHGGASSTMVVLFSALSLASDDKYWKSLQTLPENDEMVKFTSDIPSSRSADIQILQAVPLDADIFVKCHIISNTKSNAYVNVSISNSSGKVLVMGMHDMMRNPPTGNEPHSLVAHFPSAKL